MFIEGKVDTYRIGIKAERFVWNYVKDTFSTRESFGFLHFPMFKKNHSGRREIDILLFDRKLGATVIEVKGININHIESIQGHIWNFKDRRYSTAEPFNQAEQQLNMLCDDIEKKAIFYRTFSKRAVVALPYITSNQWAERGFNQLLYVPCILFKDDFENGNWVKKLESIYIYKSRLTLNDQKWLGLKKYFYVHQPKEERQENKDVFSYLFVFNNVADFIEEMEKIEGYLREGLKIYIFTSFSIPEKWLGLQEEFRNELQLLVFQSKNWILPTNKLIIRDGEDENYFLRDILAPAFPDFNYGQYTAIHTPYNDNLMITAGAGTGKTHVMIDRIFFLLEKCDITLKDIVMITFTNASTDEMKKRLQERLLIMFKLTEKTKYLYFSEEVNKMQISTIHSFSKSILTHLAHEIGYGRNVKVRSFLKTKNDIIERLADQFFQNRSVEGIVKLNLKYFDVINLIKAFWLEMEKKGLTKSEIESLDWGMVTKENHEILHDLFQYVFKRCEGLLEKEKKKENSIDTGDMIRKLKLFTNSDKLKRELKLDKYLFVDEFQDSDNTQIELVASLQNQLNHKLFVVGDIKQSIYRFRGADYTSFDRLKTRINSFFAPIALNQNYRTTSSLLKKLDKIFTVWGQESWGPNCNNSLLPYMQDDKLKGMEFTKATKDEFLHENIKENLEVETIRHIRQALAANEQLPKNVNGKIALIVRTNKQALQVMSWCEQAKIGTVQNLEGTFYKSDAVIHFKMLLDALLYPNEARYLVNLLQSPYFGYEIPVKLLVPFRGNNKKIIEYLKLHMGNDFTQYLDDLKLLPVVAVIQKIIVEKGLLQNIKLFYEAKLDNKLTVDMSVEQYQKNLYHLMNLIQQQFDSMNGSLWSINEWLTLQIQVNRNENEPIVETKSSVVEITTVHRSKGLEYHTVIIPHLNYQFINDKSSFYVQDEKEINGNERKVGWKVKYTQNNNFASLQNYEEFEVEREETRLLYVAMTRAKKRLILMMPKRIRQNTWAELLGLALDEVSHED